MIMKNLPAILVLCLLPVATSTITWVYAEGHSKPDRGLTREQAEILDHMSIVLLDDGQGERIKTIRISGVNVQIVNGAGETDAINGAGNLVIGYHEITGPGEISGSHNLVVGMSHTVTSFGGLVAGWRNTISRPFATVTGGFLNVADGGFSTICGGRENQASGTHAHVSGGLGNAADGHYAHVGGGRANKAKGMFASVAGGRENKASGRASAVSGGFARVADGDSDWAAGSLYEDE